MKRIPRCCALRRIHFVDKLIAMNDEEYFTILHLGMKWNNRFISHLGEFVDYYDNKKVTELTKYPPRNISNITKFALGSFCYEITFVCNK